MTETSSRLPLEILLVEDNPADVRIAREALKAAGFAHRLNVVMDGEEALDFLLRRGVHAGAPQPDLVLLDLKLPRLDGLAVLRVLRAQHARRTLVVVLTGSSLRDDRTRAQELAADLFVTKPVGLDAYVAEMRRFRDLALAG
jgi:CheY-like chemotaxis protein